MRTSHISGLTHDRLPIHEYAIYNTLGSMSHLSKQAVKISTQIIFSDEEMESSFSSENQI